MKTIKQLKEEVKKEVDLKEKNLMEYANKYRLENGLMPDEHKTEEYWMLKRAFDTTFARLQQINKLYIKSI